MEPVRRLAPGVAIVALIAIGAFLIARVPALASSGLSALTLAIIIGAVLGNVAHHRLAGPRTLPGLHFAQKTLLRVGVALYGLNLSLAQILHVGPAAIAVDVFIVVSTLLVGWLIGRWFGMDRETVLLTSSGSAICGAAAVVLSASTTRP